MWVNWIRSKWRKNSYHLISLSHILDSELDIGCSSVIVLNDGIAHVKRITELDVIKEFRHIEAYGGYMVIWTGFLNQLKFQMSALSPDLAAITIVIDILSKENRS